LAGRPEPKRNFLPPPLRYVTCLDLGHSGAVITQGWERRIEKTGSEGKAVKRLINTQVIYPPADGTAEALLASSSMNLAERAARVDGTKAHLDPVPGKAA
jgi:NADH:quinone reductase (non-electrogenic)